MANKPSDTAAAASIAGTQALDLETPATDVMANAAIPVETVPAKKAEGAYKNGRRRTIANDSLLARLVLGLTSRISCPPQIRRWLQPGLRLSIVGITAGLLPVALAAAFLMAHRQKVSTRPSHDVTSAGKTWLFRETAQPIRSTGIPSAKPITTNPVDPIASGNDHRPSKPFQVENATSHVKVSIGHLSRPVLTSRAQSTPVPPAILATQPKVDLLRDLPQPSAPPPPTMARTGAQTQPAKPTPLPANASATNPAPSASEGSHQLQPARLISGPPPAYPSMALVAKLGGAVMIDAVIDEKGRVTDMKVTSGPPLLINAAMEAVHSWKYAPARLNGQPIASHVQVRINFNLQ